VIHLEGMGVIGCYLAHRLAADGIDFTWHDTDEPVTAWKACTGAIFPTGHTDDQLALIDWLGHATDERFAAHMEVAAYVFSQKTPPHKGKAKWLPLAGDVKLLSVPSLHLNAQAWVPWTREVFAAQRLDPSWPKAQAAQRVVTHGFGARLARVMWGWTVPVRIHTTADLGSRRPCIYFREGRFTMAYAYPIPRTDMWYAGSSLISQRVAKSLTVAKKYERWHRDFIRLGADYVTDVEVAGPPIEGWRPVPAKGDDQLIKRTTTGELAVRPLWHSGVRHAPLVYNALKEALS
jgi:hypothetical protein